MERYRVHEGCGEYFMTFSVVEWLPVFTEELPCRVLLDSLSFCIAQKDLRVNAYVIMPTHFHAVLFEGGFDALRLKGALNSLRKFTGRRLLDYCTEHSPRCFSTAFALHAGGDRQKRFWQPTLHAEGITTEEFWRQKVQYIHRNPCRKGLVRRPEDWRFSSARFWLQYEPESADIEVADLAW